MSAIAGLWRFDGRPDAAEGCARMLAAQEIYGPDAGAQWSGDRLALGRRLMRVLPEDVLDHQPLIGGGGRFVLVADLRLDNRDQLAEALEISAPTARKLSDAAMLLAAVERWGESCLERIVGDYAFALWDAMSQRLVLARDPLGMRPLHYHRGDGFLAFASMPKGLHALPDIPYAPDEQQIAEFLAVLPEMGTRTYFLGIERVQPAHVVTITPKALASRRYWEPKRRSIVLRGPDEYAERLREILDDVVRCRLRGEKDVAATLSGGLDSAAVVATAARLLAPSGGRVIAFTSVPREGYDGPSPSGRMIDEGPFAAATAAAYANVEHVLLHTPNRSPLEDLDRVFLLSERPLMGICNLASQYQITAAAQSRKLRVLLGGAFGNLGLSYDGKELLPELFASGRWIRWWHAARGLVDRAQWSWLHVMAETLGPWFPGAAWMWVCRVRRSDDTNLFAYSALRPDRFTELDLARRARESGRDLAGRPWKDGFVQRRWSLGRTDPGTAVKGLLGTWHLDIRQPLADVRLLEFCLAVPTEQYLRSGELRALARQTLADRVPKLVLENRRTGQDSADWHERMTAARAQIADELNRLAECPAVVRAIDLPRLRRLVENWPTGGWEKPEVSSPYRLALLRAISAGDFLRRATRGNR